MTPREWVHHQSLARHRSRLPWREARKYTRHWIRCIEKAPRRAHFPPSKFIAKSIQDVGASVFPLDVKTRHDYPFRAGGALDDALHAYYQCEYTIFYGKTYKSVAHDTREGSELWHGDGGPGTCVNVMVYLTDVGALDGPFEYVPWRRSLEIYRQEPTKVSRANLCSYYERSVNFRDYRTVLGPAGTVILFSNNTLHRGGFPDPGHERLVTVYHCYPTRFGAQSREMPDKVAAYPKDPDI